MKSIMGVKNNPPSSLNCTPTNLGCKMSTAIYFQRPLLIFLDWHLFCLLLPIYTTHVFCHILVANGNKSTQRFGLLVPTFKNIAHEKSKRSNHSFFAIIFKTPRYSWHEKLRLTILCVSANKVHKILFVSFVSRLVKHKIKLQFFVMRSEYNMI